MIFSSSSQCRRCKNFLGDKACTAFAQIPDEIWNGDILHDKPYINDNGVLFNPKEISRMPEIDDDFLANLGKVLPTENSTESYKNCLFLYKTKNGGQNSLPLHLIT